MADNNGGNSTDGTNLKSAYFAGAAVSSHVIKKNQQKIITPLPRPRTQKELMHETEECSVLEPDEKPLKPKPALSPVDRPVEVPVEPLEKKTERQKNEIPVDLHEKKKERQKSEAHSEPNSPAKKDAAMSKVVKKKKKSARKPSADEINLDAKSDNDGSGKKEPSVDENLPRKQNRKSPLDKKDKVSRVMKKKKREPSRRRPSDEPNSNENDGNANKEPSLDENPPRKQRQKNEANSEPKLPDKKVSKAIKKKKESARRKPRPSDEPNSNENDGSGKKEPSLDDQNSPMKQRKRSVKKESRAANKKKESPRRKPADEQNSHEINGSPRRNPSIDEKSPDRKLKPDKQADKLNSTDTPVDLPAHATEKETQRVVKSQVLTGIPLQEETSDDNVARNKEEPKRRKDSGYVMDEKPTKHGNEKCEPVVEVNSPTCPNLLSTENTPTNLKTPNSGNAETQDKVAKPDADNSEKRRTRNPKSKNRGTPEKKGAARRRGSRRGTSK
jgi:hypothetical protein